MRQPGLYPGIPEREYHVNDGSLSSTMAKEILRSPAHLRYMLDHPKPRNPEFDLGSAVHSMTLGEGPEVVPVDALSWRTKAAQEERDAIEADGKIALLQADYDRAHNMAVAVHAHPIAGKLFRDGQAEVSAYGDDPTTGVRLRGRFDYITKRGHLIDLKTSISADPAEFARTAYQFGYDVQAVHYETVYQAATGERPNGFVHVLVEKNPPHLVSVVQLDPDFINLGRQRHARAVAAYKHALETSHWGGYPAIVHQISPQNWMEYKEQEITA